MKKEKIVKEIKRELKDIEKEFDPSDWDYQNVEGMNGDEAYNRGLYRAYESVLGMLKE